MKTLYSKMVDRFLSPKIEKFFHLGRRYDDGRRFQKEDRRNNGEDDFRYYISERRNSENTRRRQGVDERRRRWFRINTFQSRHFSWNPESEEQKNNKGRSQ